MADDKLYYRPRTDEYGRCRQEVNLANAKQYFEKAAELDNKDALYGLGKLGLRKDSEYNPNKAVDYLTTAAKGGHDYAAYTLGKLFLKGVKMSRRMWITHCDG